MQVNNNRARGLAAMLRGRALALADERAALRDELDAMPAEGDPEELAINVAKVGQDLSHRTTSVAVRWQRLHGQMLQLSVCSYHGAYLETLSAGHHVALIGRTAV
jgi:hypothetical protein